MHPHTRTFTRARICRLYKLRALRKFPATPRRKDLRAAPLGLPDRTAPGVGRHLPLYSSQRAHIGEATARPRITVRKIHDAAPIRQRAKGADWLTSAGSEQQGDSCSESRREGATEGEDERIGAVG